MFLNAHWGPAIAAAMVAASMSLAGCSGPKLPPLDGVTAGVNAKLAHEQGYTGKGVAIAFVGTGVDASQPALKGRLIASRIFIDCRNVDYCDNPESRGHGTAVAEVAAGQPFHGWPGGIAPEAELISAQWMCATGAYPKSVHHPCSRHRGLFSGDPWPSVIWSEPSSIASFFSRINAYVYGAGADIINNSWGLRGGRFGFQSSPSPRSDKTLAAARVFAAAYEPFVLNHDGLVVFAVGNGGHDNPDYIASLPYWDPMLEQGWLVGAAVTTADHPTKLAGFSNQCGRAMNYCLAVPVNARIVSPYQDFHGKKGWSLIRIGGTSNTAPQISAAAALVWQAYPYFSNAQVRQTLLSTATDLGKTGVDKVFGWGLLNVAKAVRGPAELAWGNISVNINDATSTWGNDISGQGGLIKDGDGTLVLAGTNTYTGDTTINAGVLRATQRLPGDVTINRDGVLVAMRGVDDNLINAGTVTVRGDSVTVGGDYTQSGAGILQVRAGHTLVVTGRAILDGGILKVRGTGKMAANKRAVILKAAAGVTGTFSKVVYGAQTAATSHSIHYDANSVWLSANNEH